MSIFEKLKNALFEEEYVEVDEKPKVKSVPKKKVTSKEKIKEKYTNNNDDIEYFTNDVNATVDLSKIKSKAIKNGYSFYQWSVTYGSASISGDALKVTNDDVTVEAQYKQNSVITINSNAERRCKRQRDRYRNKTL